MTAAKYILSFDQGTTSSRAIIFDKQGGMIAKSQKEITQYYPHPGWVEQDPVEIWETQMAAAREALKESGIDPRDIAALGISNQRETTILWNRKTGKPVSKAIVWQCRRTAGLCEELLKSNMNNYIHENTGLIIDAYFSATKLRWLLDNLDNGQAAAGKGDLLFGTIDSWLIWNLSKGKLHVTDYSNASRTMLYNIRNLAWDEHILSYLNIPRSLLPEVRQSSEVYGVTAQELFGEEIPIAGIAGDQQAALFGQTCFEEGMIKNTYGTGCFILMQTAEKIVLSQNKLLTTIAWGINNKIAYALEGSVFIGGAVIQWLRDEMGLLSQASESEQYANAVPDTNGVYIVPAFVGLGAPYWDMHARGTITGLTRGTNRFHIIRAALESIAFQSNDVLRAMQNDTGIEINSLRADGGGSNNSFLMQFQADISGVAVRTASITEVSALGAAYLAGLAVGFWPNIQEIKENCRQDRIFIPVMSESDRQARINKWLKAVSFTMSCHE